MCKRDKYKQQDVDVVSNTFIIQQLINKDWFTMLYNKPYIPLCSLIEDLECWIFQSPRLKFRIIDSKTGRVVYD